LRLGLLHFRALVTRSSVFPVANSSLSWYRKRSIEEIRGRRYGWAV
jgi:hypothetical protein